MAHKAQQEFCLSVKTRFPQFFISKNVLDVGSLDINGSNRGLFEKCQYTGLDVAQGRNVTLVGFAHKLEFSDGFFDTIISTECFEHDPYFSDSIKNIIRMLRSGGLLLVTCATLGRPEHGTINREPNDSPCSLLFPEMKAYYKNLTQADFESAAPISSMFGLHEFNIREDTHDLQFWGIKK